MRETGAKGLALAVIENGRPVHVRSYGIRNAAGDKLRTDTIMYGASLAKAVFAFTVMQLVDEAVLEEAHGGPGTPGAGAMLTSPELVRLSLCPTMNFQGRHPPPHPPSPATAPAGAAAAARASVLRSG